MIGFLVRATSTLPSWQTMEDNIENNCENRGHLSQEQQGKPHLPGRDLWVSHFQQHWLRHLHLHETGPTARPITYSVSLYALRSLVSNWSRNTLWERNENPHNDETRVRNNTSPERKTREQNKTVCCRMPLFTPNNGRCNAWCRKSHLFAACDFQNKLCKCQ